MQVSYQDLIAINERLHGEMLELRAEVKASYEANEKLLAIIAEQAQVIQDSKGYEQMLVDGSDEDTAPNDYAGVTLNIANDDDTQEVEMSA